MKENGTIDSNTYLRGRKRVLNEEDLQNIDNLLEKQYNFTIGEVKDPPESLDLRKNCSENRPEAGIHVQKEITARQRTGTSMMYRNRERTGTVFYRDTTQNIWYFWMKAGAPSICPAGTDVPKAVQEYVMMYH